MASSKKGKTSKSRKQTTTKSKKSRSSSSYSKSKSAKSSSKAKSQKGPVKSKSVATSETPKAMRLTFAYVGDEVKLLSQKRVDMIVPPSDPITGFRRQKGFWAEVKNVRDKTLYRHVMHNPTKNDAEIFSDDPEEGISRYAAPKRKGVFVVVVPDTPKAEAVTLSRSTPKRTGREQGIESLASKPATEIFRFKLKK